MNRRDFLIKLPLAAFIPSLSIEEDANQKINSNNIEKLIDNFNDQYEDKPKRNIDNCTRCNQKLKDARGKGEIINDFYHPHSGWQFMHARCKNICPFEIWSSLGELNL